MPRSKHNPQGVNGEERAARRINEQPWEPLPGMVKRRCERCDFLFATPREAAQATCPDCRGRALRPND